ncbi:MAG: hypothetical protein LBN95_03955 [Prevotellaceae bacterium]|nr:hypothetical protein [Prevotellaceae bacterium]
MSDYLPLNSYFERFKTYPPFFDKKISENCGIIITIPCFDDEDLFLTLNSLQNAQRPKCAVEVIVAVNSAENTPENIILKNKNIYEKLQELAGDFRLSGNDRGGYFFELSPILIENVPKKFAGVGNARKAAMDEAVRHFAQISKPDGIIVGLDCDCLVAENYFLEIEKVFAQNPDIQLSTFNFQHNFDDKKFSEQEISACKQYENYLRYYRLALQKTGFPHSFFTIGSCFAVTALAYTKVGGMARLQAGEDFYFLHKAAQYAKHCEITQKIVFPAPRVSDRVPFGTGKAVMKIIENQDFRVYNPALFTILKTFFESFETIFENMCHSATPCHSREGGNPLRFDKIPAFAGMTAMTGCEEIINYFGEDKLWKIFEETFFSTKSKEQFIKRLFSKFDGFFIVKFLNSFNNSTVFPPVDINVVIQ